MQLFFEKIRANSVALISLVVAVTALSYNTWRNELTEKNRNVRMAGFEIVVHSILVIYSVLATLHTMIKT